MEIIKFIADTIKTLVVSAYLVSSIITCSFRVIQNVQINYYEPPIIFENVLPIEPNNIGRQGTKGRLIFDNYDFSVALFESNQYNAQRFVDDEDSAAWFMWNGNQSPIIADHCTQGFDIICKCRIDDICHIIDGSDYQQYRCIGVDHNGINADTDLYLSSGYNFAWNNDPGYLYMYTCTKPGDSYHITVTIWEPVYDEDELITIIDEDDLIPIIDEP